MLVVEKIGKRFGGLEALHDVSFSVDQGKTIGLIGPNGSGKTTLFNVMSGFLSPTSGEIWLKKERISGLKPHIIAKKRLARTFQIPQVFDSLTVLESVLVPSLCFLPKNLALEYAEEILTSVGLITKGKQLSNTLSMVDLKALEIAKALACRPEILLLDETMSGLTDVEAQTVLELISDLQAGGMTLIVIEHTMKIIEQICDWVIVLNFGSVIAEGRSEDIRHNTQVIEAYLGSEEL